MKGEKLDLLAQACEKRGWRVGLVTAILNQGDTDKDGKSLENSRLESIEVRDDLHDERELIGKEMLAGRSVEDTAALLLQRMRGVGLL